MTDHEYSVLITRIDGNALRNWLERNASKTGATQEQIDRIVGQTGQKKQEKGGSR